MSRLFDGALRQSLETAARPNLPGDAPAAIAAYGGFG